MSGIQNKQIFSKLLAMTSSDEIASLIAKDDFFKAENCLWNPYGGQELNVRQVEGQMKSSSNALVEKITNSIDALLMRRCYEIEGVPPESGNPKLPKMLLEAIAKYFGSEEEIAEKRSEWSKQHLGDLANIFHAGREELARTEDYQVLKERLEKFFENEIFEKWDKEYQEKSLTSADEDNRELDKLIEKAIVDDPELKDLLGIGEEIKIPKGKEKEKEEYRGEDYPKKFEFIGGQPKEVDKISYAIASFRTEAKDNLLTRKKERFLIEWTPSKFFDVVLRGMNKGIISLRVDCRANIKADDEDKITFILSDQDKKRKFEQTVHFRAIETPPYEGFYFPTYFEPQKDILKIPPKVSRKFTFATDVANDYFTRDKDVGSVESEERDDLQIKRFRLNDGILEITFYTPIDILGKRADIKLAIADAAGHRFDFVIPFEIVPLEESSKLNEPKKNFVHEKGWPSHNGPDGQWNEHDIAGVDSSRTQGGLIVNLNVDSKPLRELKKIVSVDKIESAKNKYLADVYIYSLYLYFELKNDPDKDRILSTSMRAVGKALPGMIRKII